MPAVVRPWLRQTARDRWRDALCNGDTPLPRRRHQHPALALAALATAFVHLSPVDARARKSPAPSPFQPSLTDPRNVQRFKRAPIQTDARHGAGGRSCRRRARAKPASIPPARSARRRKPRRSPASRVRCRRRRRRCRGRRRRPAATPARRRSRRARPMPTPTSRRMRRRGGRRAAAGCLRADRRARRHVSAEAIGRGHARLRQQSVARPERQELGLHGGRAGAASCNRTGRATSSAPICAAATRNYDSHVVAEPSAARRQGLRAPRRDARHQDQRREPLFPVDRLSGQPEPAGRHRQAADLHILRQHARPDAALQPSAN